MAPTNYGNLKPYDYSREMFGTEPRTTPSHEDGDGLETIAAQHGTRKRALAPCDYKDIMYGARRSS